TLLLVDVELDPLEQCRPAVRDHRGENLGDELAGRGLLANRDRLDRRALSGVRPLVDHRHSRTVAHVYGAGPGEKTTPAHAVQLHLPEVTLVDLHEHVGATMPVRRQRIELTWTTNFTVAMGDLDALYLPFDEGHGGTPCCGAPPGQYTSRGPVDHVPGSEPG